MPDPVQPGVAQVRKGETLSDVARRFGTTVDNILALNPQFDPNLRKVTTYDRMIEESKALAGESGRNINAVQEGELVRVAALEDNYFVNEIGLQGEVFEERLLLNENNRLMALRRYADGWAGGKVDSFVTAEEARGFMQWAQQYLSSRNYAGPERTALDAFEQKTLIDIGNRKVSTTEGDGYDDNTRRVFRLAPESFSEKKSPDLVPAPAFEAKLNNIFASYFVPTALALSPDFGKSIMLNIDRPTSAAVKVFTPNMNIARVAGNKGTKGEWLGQAKVHGWLAARTELAVSRIYVSDTGSKTRTATVSAAVSWQQEGVFDASIAKFDFRSFMTKNNAAQIQYQITTNPERLAKILNGEIITPNPYEPSTMEPGDTVTITSGPLKSTEYEQRILFNPAKGKKASAALDDAAAPVVDGKSKPNTSGGLRAGLDIKYDDVAIRNDSRLVVRKLEDNHVQVFHGSGQQQVDALGIGLIVNPDLGNSPAWLRNNSRGAFFRLLPQCREIAIHNQFHYVELDLNDRSKGGGNDHFRHILSTGEVPTAQCTQPIEGVIQHGTLDFHEAKSVFALQTTIYNERQPGEPDPPAPPATESYTVTIGKNFFGKNASQYLEQNNIDLMSSETSLRRMQVRHVYPKLVVRGSSTYHDDAMRTETKLGSGSEAITSQHTELGGVRLTEVNEINSGTGRRYVWPMLMSQNKGDKQSVERALTAMLADKAAGKAPLFEDFVVRGQDASGNPVEYRDEQALAYLQSRNDPSNDLFGFVNKYDKVTIRITTKEDQQRTNEAKTTDFTRQFVQDYLTANKHDPNAGFLKTYMDAEIDKDRVQTQAIAQLLGSELANVMDGGINRINIQNAGSGEEIRQILTGFDLGRWMENVQGYRTKSGVRVNGTEKDAYYPVRVVVDVSY